jgi:putative membrane protein insertion efficiency factor
MKIVLLLACTFIYSYTCLAQQKEDDMELIKLHINQSVANENTQFKNTVKIQKTYNPGKLLLYVPLYFYQKIISEQVSAVCSFEPSCSAFSIQSIKQLGILKGLLLTADRLTRCNGQAQAESEYYLYDPLKAKVIDEPDMYKSKN